MNAEGRKRLSDDLPEVATRRDRSAAAKAHAHNDDGVHCRDLLGISAVTPIGGYSFS